MSNKWRVWRPAAEIVAFVGVILLVFYATGDHAPPIVKGRTYTVCDLSAASIEAGQSVRISGILTGDGSPSIHEWSCPDRWLNFALTADALQSAAGRGLAETISKVSTGQPDTWRGGFYVDVEGRAWARRGYQEIGSVQVTAVRTWRYLGDGSSQAWRKAPPAPPPARHCNMIGRFMRCR